MSQTQRDHQTHFLQRCQESYDLVMSFLNDSLPWGPVPETKIGYSFDPEVRNTVKEKVIKTMEVLANAIERHGYVNQKILFFSIVLIY